MRYQAVFFLDPYDTGVRDVIMTDDLDDLLDQVTAYLMSRSCGYNLLSWNGSRWVAMDRVCYRLINQRLGRF